MSLQAKVLSLKLQAAIAARHAAFWEKQINLHGEAKTEAFYTHLGLNHLQTKSYEWEGLTLSREPKDHEKICVKGVSEAQDAGRAQVSAILLKLRTDLISDAVKAIKKLTPASYHELILTVPDKFKSELRDQLGKVYHKGRKLVARELGKTKAIDDELDDDFDGLDDLVDLTDGRVLNEVQARITSAAARFTLLGLAGKVLWDAVEKEVGDGSTGWLERIAGESSNKVVALGRADEMSERASDIDHFEYSSLLDLSTCEPCFAEDGKEAQSMDELEEVPLSDCAGGGSCRCFIVAVSI